MKSNLPESSKGQTLRRRIDTIIALLFLTVLVGSLVVVVNLMHHGTNHAASASSRLVPTLSVYVGTEQEGLINSMPAQAGRSGASKHKGKRSLLRRSSLIIQPTLAPQMVTFTR